MRSIIAAALVVAFPASVYATVIIKTDLEPPLSGVYLPGQTVSFDTYLENTDPAQNEHLDAFTIVIKAQGFGAAPGVPRFVIPPPEANSGDIRFPLPGPSHPYVFTDYLASEPLAYPVDPGTRLSDAGTVVLIASLPRSDEEADIGPARNGVARLSVVIPPDAVPGRYPISGRARTRATSRIRRTATLPDPLQSLRMQQPGAAVGRGKAK
jgi:hypothetical protein